MDGEGRSKLFRGNKRKGVCGDFREDFHTAQPRENLLKMMVCDDCEE